MASKPNATNKGNVGSFVNIKKLRKRRSKKPLRPDLPTKSALVMKDLLPEKNYQTSCSKYGKDEYKHKAKCPFFKPL